MQRSACGDRLQVQRLALAQLRDRPRQRAADRETPASMFENARPRPCAATAASVPALGGGHRLARGPGPSLAKQLAERAGRLAVHQGHHLVPAVEIAMVVAGLLAPGVVVQVLRRVPTIRSDIAAAAERQRVVDDDHLLMVRGAHRQFGVQPELHLGAPERHSVGQREEMLGRGDRQGRVPAEQPHVEAGLFGELDQDPGDAVAVRPATAGLGVHQRVRLERPVQQVDSSATAPRIATSAASK